jgi:large subunit ribosomal protein L21
MYAVVETGGKQYRVAPGDSVNVETLPGEIGSEVVLDKVLCLVGDDHQVIVGSGASSAKVKCTITEHGRADKILVFKFKRKKQYRKTIGHRQNFTRVKVSEIVA